MRSRLPRELGRGTGVRAQMPLLDRLIDDAPDVLHDPAEYGADSVDDFRRSVQRDLEALLNARRRWRSWPDGYSELAQSPVGYGIADFAAGSFNDPRQRDLLRSRIEQTIRRFEPRLSNVRVALIDPKDPLEATIHFRITGMLLTDPAPEPISYATTIDAATTVVVVQPAPSDTLSQTSDA